jgi:hypothetical protein
MQPIKLETIGPDGAFVAGVDCSLSNDHGSFTVQSGSTVQVRRSSRNLDIYCKDATGQEAKARAISRANAGMAGNMFVGGAFGAIVDHSTGTAYSYPAWMQLEFGRNLVFDRSNEVHGSPVAAYGGPVAPVGWSASSGAAGAAGGNQVAFREVVVCVPRGTREGDVIRSFGYGDVRVIRVHSADTHCAMGNAEAMTTATVAARSVRVAPQASAAPSGYTESIECVPAGTRDGDVVPVIGHGRVRVIRVHPANTQCGMQASSTRNQITATVALPASRP